MVTLIKNSSNNINVCTLSHSHFMDVQCNVHSADILKGEKRDLQARQTKEMDLDT